MRPRHEVPLALSSWISASTGASHRLQDLRKSRVNIGAQVDPQRSPAALHQHLEVTSRLRRFCNAERVLLTGHRQIGSIVAGDLEENAGVRPTFIRLTSGVKKTRA